MSINNKLLNELLTCSNCNKVMQYFDYLSHLELCNLQSIKYNNDNTEDININLYDNIYGNSNGNSNSNENTNTNNNLIFDNTYGVTYYDYENYINNDNMISRTNSNLYNPMIGRGTNNSNHSNNNHIENQASIQDLSVDIGLGIENLSLYGEKIPMNEDSYCVICMNTFEKGKSFYVMKCLHSFCDDCSKRWFDFKSVCPLCKTNMKSL
jgi:hypothetical protein